MEEMSRKERLLNSIQRKPIDRLPVQLDFSPIMLDKMCAHFGVPQKGEEELLPFIDNHLVYAFLNDTYGMLRKRMHKTNPEMLDDFGVGWDMRQEGIYLTRHPLEDMRNYRDYKFPDPNRSGLMDFAKATIERYKKDYVVCSYQVTLLFERAYALRGYENFLVDIMLEDDFVNELLEKITDYQVGIAKNYVHLGVDCGRIGDDYGTQLGMLFSPKKWREMFKLRLKRIIDVYKGEGLPVIYHSCGNILPIIPELIEIGVDVLNNIQAEAMPKEVLSENFGDRICFYGGIPTQNLPFAKKEELREEVQKTIEVLGRHGSYIVSPGIAVMSDVPIENVLTLIDSIKETNVKNYN